MALGRKVTFAAIAVLALGAVSPAFAKTMRHGHHAGGGGGSWDGHWAGAWGGNDPTAINVHGGRVVSYEYGGQTHAVSSSRVSATRISYGEADIAVTMTRTGANSAHATIHSSHGDGAAELTRQ